MISAEELSRIEALMVRHEIRSFEYQHNDQSIELSRKGGQIEMAQQQAQPKADKPMSIHAPTIGLFQARHPLAAENPAFPRQARQGEIIAWLRVGTVLRPVPAPRDGLVGPPLCPDGKLVGYGEQLF